MILKTIKSIPLIGDWVAKIQNSLLYKKRKSKFRGSEEFWREKYLTGGHSGYGSYNELAEFKAEVINTFIKEHDYNSYAEFGCGDGNQISLIDFPNYTGYDISEKSIELCHEKFSTKENMSFHHLSEFGSQKFDVTLSLDVIFHLVEDEVFGLHMKQLFEAADKAVIIYASNTDDNSDNYYPQVKHRKFTDYVKKMHPEWKLDKKIANKYPYEGSSRTGSFSDFYFFKRA